jgi:Tol biopolymer transport system component
MTSIRRTIINVLIASLLILISWIFPGKDLPQIENDSIPLPRYKSGIIAYSVTYKNNTNKIFIMNEDGSGNRQITSQEGRPLSPVWSPDGLKIAYYNHINDQKWSLFIMNSDGTNSRQLTDEQNTLDWCPSWSSSGSQILFTRSYTSPVWRSELWVMNSDGTNIRKICNAEGQGADWSPDGTRILYFNYSERGGYIWIMDSKGENIRKLSESNAEGWWPNWSPDGSKIAFQSKRDGNFEIYTMNADGSNPIRLTNNMADDEEPKWSPDGSRIAFSSLRDGHYEIYVMNADGSDQKRLTYVDGNAINPDWMPVK